MYKADSQQSPTDMPSVSKGTLVSSRVLELRTSIIRCCGGSGAGSAQALKTDLLCFQMDVFKHYISYISSKSWKF